MAVKIAQRREMSTAREALKSCSWTFSATVIFTLYLAVLLRGRSDGFEFLQAIFASVLFGTWAAVSLGSTLLDLAVLRAAVDPLHSEETRKRTRWIAALIVGVTFLYLGVLPLLRYTKGLGHFRPIAAVVYVISAILVARLARRELKRLYSDLHIN